MHRVGWVNFKIAKSRPVQDQKNIFTYSLAKLIADYLKPLTAWKVSVFGVILVCIFPHSDQNNSK